LFSVSSHDHQRDIDHDHDREAYRHLQLATVPYRVPPSGGTRPSSVTRNQQDPVDRILGRFLVHRAEIVRHRRDTRLYRILHHGACHPLRKRKAKKVNDKKTSSSFVNIFSVSFFFLFLLNATIFLEDK